MAALGGDLHQGGYDVLLFDLRGTARAIPRGYSQLDHRERADIRAVMTWAADAASRRIA